MKTRWDMLLTVLLVVCALVTTGLVVWKTLLAPQGAGAPQVDSKPVLVSNWRGMLGAGTRMGDAAAPVQMIVFSDFECPFCKSFRDNLAKVSAKHPGKIALTYIHYPLPMHRFAIPAARVAECAGAQGRFGAMHDVLFAGQDQFGLTPWSDYAAKAGVPDRAAFDACIARKDDIPAVRAGTALAKKLDVQGTPTILMNGWKLMPGDADALDAAVERALAGKDPA